MLENHKNSSERIQKRKFKVILFDLGSTLVFFTGNWDEVLDEAIFKMVPVLSNILNKNILEHEFHSLYKSALTQYYINRDIDYTELSTHKLLNNLLNASFHTSLPDEDIILVMDEFYSYTRSHWVLDEETLPVLQKLRSQGYRLGLISNAGYASDVTRQLENFQLSPFFDQILISADVGYRKPHLTIFQKAIEFFGQAPHDFVMIGDTLSADIIGARKAGMSNVWINRWASPPSTHYRDDAIIPDRKISSLSELPDLLIHWDDSE
ncbi:MAG: HAD family hydrolase [Anaerolineaceae bacterium]|nr:HAD family hydrolase [Anaerolineaceae bacterium]